MIYQRLGDISENLANFLFHYLVTLFVHLNLPYQSYHKYLFIGNS